MEYHKPTDLSDTLIPDQIARFMPHSMYWKPSEKIRHDDREPQESSDLLWKKIEWTIPSVWIVACDQHEPVAQPLHDSITMLRTDQLDYDLPEDLIATRPAERRDEARLLVVHCSRPNETPLHCHIRDLPDLLDPHDLLILNETKVIPARLVAKRADTNGRVTGLYLNSIAEHEWSVMLKSNGRLKPGHRLVLLDQSDQPSDSILHLLEKENGTWRVELESDLSTMECLDQLGRTPLPPYIQRARSFKGNTGLSENEDRERYQTIYAKTPGAVAAPTAGLHLTHSLLTDLTQRGIDSTRITLHVGSGTFKPIDTEYVQHHPIHSEHYTLTNNTIHTLSQARKNKKRFVAVGTTTVRALESLPDDWEQHTEIDTETNLLITPGYQFRLVDVLLTNFHLPRSSLLALVAAMTGLERLMEIYEEAVRERYRFYSYGDAMLILP